MKIVSLLVVALMLCSCATTTHQSMLIKDQSGSANIYPIGEWDAFDITFNELQSKYTDSQINLINNGEHRGYRFTTRFGLDSESYFFEIVPMVGRKDGQEISGFLVEGESRGTRIGTSVGINQVLSSIETAFAAKSKAIRVSNVARTQYGMDDSRSVAMMSINTFGNQPAGPRAVFIMPSKPNVSKSDPEFLEYRQLVCNALAIQEMSCVSNAKEANTIIFVNYGISSPMVEYNTWSRPIYSMNYIAPSQQQVTFNNSLGQATGSATIQDTSNQFGRFENQYVGQESGTTKRVTFHRVIELEAAEKRSVRSGEINFYWKTKIESTGSSNDLRNIFKYLLQGATPYLGKSTGHIVTLKVPIK